MYALPQLLHVIFEYEFDVFKTSLDANNIRFYGAGSVKIICTLFTQLHTVHFEYSVMECRNADSNRLSHQLMIDNQLSSKLNISKQTSYFKNNTKTLLFVWLTIAGKFLP